MRTIESGPASDRGGNPPVSHGGRRFVLWPHRSLSRHGQQLLLMLVAAGAMLPVLHLGLQHEAGLTLLMIGVPCLSAPVALGLAFRANNRAAALCQTIEIGHDRLVVRTRVRGCPERVTEFNPYWVRVEIERDSWGDDRLVLAEGRRRLAIGAFLGPEERKRIGVALQRSLQALKSGNRIPADPLPPAK